MRYLRACARLVEVEPWSSPIARQMFEVAATGHGPTTRHALVLQHDGPSYGPGFGLLDPDVSLRTTPEDVIEIHCKGALAVTLVDVPPVARTAFEDAFGVTRFPLALSLRRSPDHAPLLLEEIQLLTGVMECILDLLSEPRASSEVDGRTITVKPHRDDALFRVPAGRA